MKKYAVIVAGGAGTRMGGDLPKQFMLLKDKPVLYYSLKAFLDAFEDLEVILVLPIEYTDMGQEIIDAYFDKERIQITEGGDTRFQSVKNGLELIADESVIFVHDAVRCLLTTELIHRCYKQAVEKGSAIPVIKSKDSLRLIDKSETRPIDRNNIMLVQTPQTFQSKILLAAYNAEYDEKFTDEATVVENAEQKVSVIEGEENNIKITRPVDMMLAEQILEVRTLKSDL